ncbi:MAG: exosortase/archaeosortase family protein [Planctomycetota bacterium]|nr:exosortase/archaeosortase family protein [Planctomycetota bacterium]
MDFFRPESKAARVLRTSLLVLAPAVAIVLIYGETLLDLADRWSDDPNYSHGWAVPFVSLAFAWRGFKSHGSLIRKRIPTTCVLQGVVCLVLGLALHAWSWLAAWLFMDVVSLVILLRGALWLLGGRRGIRAYAPAVTLLIFMAPLPFGTQLWIANHLQHSVSVIAETSLAVLDVPVIREGYFLHFRNHTLEIAEACSGLRQISAFLATGFVIGALLNRGRAFLTFMLVCSIPIAVLANCLRVIVTGLIIHLGSAEWAQGFFHHLEGMGIVLVGFILQGLLASVILRKPPQLRFSTVMPEQP